MDHHRGQSLDQSTTFYAVRYAIVHAWARPGIGTDWRAWPKAAGRGVRSNYRPRPKKVVSWLRAATQKVRQLPQRLAAGCDVGLHLSSPRR